MKSVRDLCIFAKQNLANDPPFSHIDLLLCRNVLIYFDQALQRQVISTLHYALDHGGYLVLGMSEGLRDVGARFSMVDRERRIHKKIGGVSKGADMYPTYFPPMPPAPSGLNIAVTGPTWSELELQRTADRIAVARFAPPGFLIDAQMNILQLRGLTSAYIDPPPGPVSWNLARLLKAGISKAVLETAREAIRQGIPVQAMFPQTDSDGNKTCLRIDVLPLATAPDSLPYFLIFLLAEDGEGNALPMRPAAALLPGSVEERAELFAAQQEELAGTRSHLQSLMQEREGRHQDLVAASEEIQAANEELQSTNEELGTIKEELQSTNEELQTLNEELEQRNETLFQSTNDLNNLLTSVHIPIIMLTRDLRIRRFTPPVEALLNITESDIGRQIRDVRLKFKIENLESILLRVLDTLVAVNEEVQDDVDCWYLLRVRPYRTSDNRIEGLVVILLDIDAMRRTELSLLATRKYAESVVESVPVSVVVLRRDLTVQTANTAFRDLIRVSAPDVNGRDFPELVRTLWGLEEISDKLVNLLASPAAPSFELEHVSTTADRRVLAIKAIYLPGDEVATALIVIEDITMRRQVEGKLDEQRQALVSAVEVAGHTLDRTQGELRQLTSHLFTVQEEERQKIARELHDDISQRLSLVELVMDGAMSGPPGEMASRSKEVRQELQGLSTDVRVISHQLHPAILIDLGLSAALKALVTEFGKREEMVATYLGMNVPEIAMQPAVTAVYRIAQEALRNVARHAGKTHVKVILEARDGVFCLEVVDLGMGFDKDTEQGEKLTGLGMISMKERALMAQGTLNVRSSLGYGTSITAEIPFAA